MIKKTAATAPFEFVLLLLLIVMLPCSVIVEAVQDSNWVWRFREDPDSLRRTTTELYSLLDQNKGLIVVGDTVVAAIIVLDNALLDSVDLAGRDLSFVAIENSMLRGANLSGCNMVNASFRKSDLSGSNLSGSNIHGSDFTDAKLIGAILARSTCQYVRVDIRRFSGKRKSELIVPFPMASFVNADLTGANLAGADITGARLDGAIFEVDSLPNAEILALAQGLDNLRYTNRPNKLMELQARFHELGFGKAERQVICAIKRHNQRWWEKLIFDYTSEWGSNLGRPWIWIGGFAAIATALYFISMLLGGRSGLYVREPAGGASPEIGLIWYRHSHQHASETPLKWRRISNWHTSHWKWPMVLRLLWWAVFFSLMSAFNIGFRDINFGRWVRLLTKRDFDVSALGWVRPVAGVQSILSLGLLILWLISLTGVPFRFY